MIILFCYGTMEGYIGFDGISIASTQIHGNPKLLSLIHTVSRKGIPIKIEYTCKGQVRRRTIYKPINNLDDILSFLQSIKKEFGIYNIQILQGNNTMQFDRGSME